MGFVRCHSLQSVSFCFTGVATENQALQNKLITKGFGGYKTLLVWFILLTKKDYSFVQN